MERLHSTKLASGVRGASTLKYVDVAEVHDGVIVLRNGALRAIVMMSSINFDLKSTQEQDAIVLQYQQFLNSLDFPVQIVISSRRLNIAPYIKKLDERERVVTNDALRAQIAEYRTFIKELTSVRNIMTKYFYIVVPFSPVENENAGLFARLLAALHPAQKIAQKRELFETYKNQLFQRVDHVAAALSGTGVRGRMLNTAEILELLYNAYNPSLFSNTSLSEHVQDVDIRGL